MIEKHYDMTFDIASSGRPWMIFPKVVSDNRGTFSEVLVGEYLDGIKQVNRSTSCQWTVRGCHAQRAPKCQSKLVEALNLPIYDIITDARPDSKTFGLTEVYFLDPVKQNKLYVPHGFLHSFVVPPSKDKPNDAAYFMYYCDETYSRENEVSTNPMEIIPRVVKMKSKEVDDESHPLYSLVEMFKTPEKLVLSQKDVEGYSYQAFMENVSREFRESKKLWYS